MNNVLLYIEDLHERVSVISNLVKMLKRNGILITDALVTDIEQKKATDKLLSKNFK